MNKRSRALVFVFCVFLGCSHPAHNDMPKEMSDSKNLVPYEKFFKNIRQLTQGGSNTHAHWSFNGKWLTFQHRGSGLLNEDIHCDQIYKIRNDGTQVQRLSTLAGRSAYPSFLPNDERVLFSSTAALGGKCFSESEKEINEFWKLDPYNQLLGVKIDGTDSIPLDASAPRAYYGETAGCRDGSILFTSNRNGTLELYHATAERFGALRNVHRITNTVGYNGGASFSPDCKQITWQALRPRPGKEQENYDDLLSQNKIKPKVVEIWIANADGSHARQVTHLNSVSISPTFTEDGKRILFSSNLRDLKGQKSSSTQTPPENSSSDLYIINTNGTGLELVSGFYGSDSFPSFSPNWKHLVFSSRRNAKSAQETNLFVTDWVSHPSPSLSIQDLDPADRFWALTRDLAAPEMEGRGLGTQGLSRAEDLIVKRFSAIGLRPFYSVFPGDQESSSYKMPVEISLGSRGTVKAHNILGIWGNGCKTQPPILIGAHLDHLGMGSSQSLEPNQTGLHAGADDNASGVAALLESARIIQAKPTSKNACFLFAAFTGEEAGIVGSSRLAELFKKIRLRPKAMFNLDMVGRMENNTLITFGSDSAKEWSSLIDQECSSRYLKCGGGGDGYGPSDHMPFYIAHTPVLHFFTGPHLDYHRTTDTVDHINATGGIQAAEVVAAIALRASLPSQKVSYRKPSVNPLMGSHMKGKDQKHSRTYFGSIPDYSTLMSPHGPGEGSAPEGGVPLSGVRPNSPAEKAGIREGDVLKKIHIYSIKTLQDFTNALVELHPGDTVTVEIIREGKPLKLTTTLGQR